MAEFIIDNSNVHNGSAVEEKYITQIDLGGNDNIYDIATHHKITFKEGSESFSWNGLSDLTVTIPTITDLITDPIKFAGTVDSSSIGNINDDAVKGDLKFVTGTQSFEFSDMVCEPGDMLIYDGTKWNIISGEDQVKIYKNGKEASAAENDVKITTTSTKILDVEGKSLSLSIPSIIVSKDNAKNVSYAGTTDPSYKYIKLKQDESGSSTVTTTSFDLPTKLANGTVTMSVGNSSVSGATAVVTSVDLTKFNGGTLPSSNYYDVDQTLNGSATLTSVSTKEDFVSSVSVNTSEFFTEVTGSSYLFSTISSIGTTSGTTFVTGIADETTHANVEFYAPSISNESTTLSYLQSFGNASVSSILTGISQSGSVSIDGFTNNYVVTGLTPTTTETSTDKSVLANVSVTASDINVSVSMSVENNVLKFNPVSVTPSFTVTNTYKDLVGGKLKYTDHIHSSTSVNWGSFKGYKFDTDTETICTVTSKKWGFGAQPLTITSGGYNVTDLTVTVPSNHYVKDINVGSSASIEAGFVTTKYISGSVATTLTSSSTSLDVTISTPGAYSLVNASVSDANCIKVGTGDGVNFGGTIKLDDYVTGVYYDNK